MIGKYETVIWDWNGTNLKFVEGGCNIKTQIEHLKYL